MDWTIGFIIVAAAWAVLNIIGGERQRRLQEMQVAMESQGGVEGKVKA